MYLCFVPLTGTMKPSGCRQMIKYNGNSISYDGSHYHIRIDARFGVYADEIIVKKEAEEALAWISSLPKGA